MSAATLTADDLFTMINLRGRSTGLPMNIWLGPRGHARHAARIKVQMDHRPQFDFDRLAVVSLLPEVEVIEGELSADDLEQLRRYVALNRQAILDHWDGLTDGVDLARALVTI